MHVQGKHKRICKLEIFLFLRCEFEMKFVSVEDLLNAVENLNYTKDDIKIILENCPCVLTKNTWRRFVAISESYPVTYYCSYSERYIFDHKTNTKNNVFAALLSIDKKIGLYRESDVIHDTIKYYCFDIWKKNAIIQVCHYL